MLNDQRNSSLRSNATVLDVISVSQLIGIIGTLLVGFFTVIKPEASNGLALFPRLAFWTLHVGLGLIALLIASAWIRSGARLPKQKLASIVITGCAAALLATPGYMLLDAIFASSITDLDPDTSTDSPLFAAPFIVILKEVFELLPLFLATWLLINLPLLVSNSKDAAEAETAVTKVERTNRTPTTNQSFARTKKLAGSDQPLLNPTKSTDKLTEHKAEILKSLPDFIGTDIIAISSDLHYLNVWTEQGRATVLGNLRDAVIELDDKGMQIHRSHWVAYKHVKRVVGNANKGACILTNNLRIPVSRRRWKDVQQYFGRGVISGSASSMNT